MEANANADSPTLSADGNLVGFTSLSTNLVPGDTNGAYDIFVHDCTAGTTERVSITSDQQEAVGVIGSNSPKISSDGNHIAFASRSTNLVAGDDNLFSDVFVHDIQTGITSLMSVNSEGQSGNSISGLPTISGDGGFVAFYSWADMFTAKDTNGVTDAFVRDRWNGEGTNSIYLAGPSVSEVPKPLGFTWQTSHGNARYWLSYSSSNQGSTFGGHPLDLGAPSSILTAGVTSANGLGRFQTRRVSPALVGQTLYFELTCLDGAGTLYDSNVHGVTFR